MKTKKKMKTKILISFLLLLLPISVYSVAWMLQGRWDLSFCEICHDRIYTYINYEGNQSYTVIPTYSSLIEEQGKKINPNDLVTSKLLSIQI